MSDKQAEREKALEFAITEAANGRVATHPYNCDCVRCGAVTRLKGCVPVEREYLAQLERALWIGMRDRGYPECSFSGYVNDQIAGAMFAEVDFIDVRGNWTPAAHAFAERMNDSRSKT